jgi:hypothetical protein
MRQVGGGIVAAKPLDAEPADVRAEGDSGVVAANILTAVVVKEVGIGQIGEGKRAGLCVSGNAKARKKAALTECLTAKPADPRSWEESITGAGRLVNDNVRMPISESTMSEIRPRGKNREQSSSVSPLHSLRIIAIPISGSMHPSNGQRLAVVFRSAWITCERCPSFRGQRRSARLVGIASTCAAKSMRAGSGGVTQPKKTVLLNLGRRQPIDGQIPLLAARDLPNAP